MLHYYEAIATLADIPGIHAARAPDDVALLCEDRQLTYGALANRSDQVARGLAALGLEPGARVALLGHDSEASYEILFGVAKAGCVLVPISWRLDSADVGHILRDSGAKVIFVSAESRSAIGDALVGLPDLRATIALGEPAPGATAYAAWRDLAPATHLPRLGEPGDPVVQVYTSGTSGRPKGVVLSSRGFLALSREAERAGVEIVDFRPGDVVLLALPTFHVGGLWLGVHSMVNGVRAAIMRVFTAGAALRLIERHRATKVAFVPAMLRFILSEPSCATTDVSSVGLVVYGGSPMPLSILERAKALFKCRFAQNYGLSETTNLAVFMPPEDHGDPDNPRLKAAGKPLPGVRVRILDESGRDVAPGQVGEISFLTPSCMLEYWNLPEETARTIVDGWLRTGDGGFVDADGFVFITDRIKDLIISAGENVYPSEIERVLIDHEGVSDVAVIGIPDERWGEVPMAVVVRRPGSSVTKGDVLTFARKRLPSFKVPRSVDFVDQLPRNASGKVLKRILRAPYWVGRERLVN